MARVNMARVNMAWANGARVNMARVNMARVNMARANSARVNMAWANGAYGTTCAAIPGWRATGAERGSPRSRGQNTDVAFACVMNRLLKTFRNWRSRRSRASPSGSRDWPGPRPEPGAGASPSTVTTLNLGRRVLVRQTVGEPEHHPHTMAALPRVISLHKPDATQCGAPRDRDVAYRRMCSVECFRVGKFYTATAGQRKRMSWSLISLRPLRWRGFCNHDL
jgi:hypothetical protein